MKRPSWLLTADHINLYEQTDGVVMGSPLALY